MSTKRPYLNPIVPKISVGYYHSIYTLILHQFSSCERQLVISL